MQTTTVRDLMTQNPTTCKRGTPVVEVARMMVEQDCGAIPVVADEGNRHLEGIITDRDIACRVVAKGLDPATTHVADAMSEEMVVALPEATLDECVRLMATEQVRRLPVVDRSGCLLGIVSQADLARASAQQPELEDELAEMVEEVSEPTMGG